MTKGVSIVWANMALPQTLTRLLFSYPLVYAGHIKNVSLRLPLVTGTPGIFNVFDVYVSEVHNDVPSEMKIVVF